MDDIDRLLAASTDQKLTGRQVFRHSNTLGTTLEQGWIRCSDTRQQDRLLELLRDGQPWKKQEIQHLINDEFDVSFHPVYLSVFLEKLGLSYAILQTKRPSRPDNAEEMLDERAENAFDESMKEPHNKREGDDPEGWIVDDDICTDIGTVMGFLDTSHPQPWDNSQRLYTVDDPHITQPW